MGFRSLRSAGAQVSANVPNAFFTSDGPNQLLIIPNANPGEYQVSLVGAGSGEALFGASYVSTSSGQVTSFLLSGNLPGRGHLRRARLSEPRRPARAGNNRQPIARRRLDPCGQQSELAGDKRTRGPGYAVDVSRSFHGDGRFVRCSPHPEGPPRLPRSHNRSPRLRRADPTSRTNSLRGRSASSGDYGKTWSRVWPSGGSSLTQLPRKAL